MIALSIILGILLAVSLAWNVIITRRAMLLDSMLQDGGESIEECLDEINPRYRRVLELRLVQGVARDRAAAAMDVSIGTLDVLLFRACKAFRKVYVQRYGEGPQREFGQP